MQSVAVPALLDMLRPQLTNDDGLSDLTITCGDYTFHVRKSVVCAGSDWFRIACRPGGFMESHTNHIVLPHNEDSLASTADGDSPAIIARVIAYLHGIKGAHYALFDRRSFHLRGSRPRYDPLLIAQLHIAAQKYQIAKLARFTADVFKLASFSISSRPHMAQAFADTLRFVYLNSPAAACPLKKEIVNQVVAYPALFLDTASSDDMLAVAPEVALDIVPALPRGLFGKGLKGRTITKTMRYITGGLTLDQALRVLRTVRSGRRHIASPKKPRSKALAALLESAERKNEGPSKRAKISE